MTTAFIALFGIVMLGCAVGVVTSRNLVHSVFWLAGALIATAGIFVCLEAPLLAGIQVVLYTGGVITLMLFGVMLTQHQPDGVIDNPIEAPGRAAVIALVLFGVMVTGLWGHDWPTEAKSGASTQVVGELLLTDHLLAFEVLSVLLLAAMIGAIVLARKADP